MEVFAHFFNWEGADIRPQIRSRKILTVKLCIKLLFRLVVLFSFSDTLLCHDDELEGRRIAYIFYLVSSWTEQDGGTLDLYNVDGKQIGSLVVKS